MDILTRCKGKSIIIVLLFIINMFASFKMLYAISLLSGIETFIRILVSIILLIILGGFILPYIDI